MLLPTGLIEELFEIKQAIQALEERKEVYESQILELLDEGSHAVGDFVVTLSHQDRFNAAEAFKALNDEQYQKTLVPTPSSAQAKKMLTEEEYKLCLKATKTSVKVTKPGDDD